MTTTDLYTNKWNGDSRGYALNKKSLNKICTRATFIRFIYTELHNGNSFDNVNWDMNFKAQA